MFYVDGRADAVAVADGGVGGGGSSSRALAAAAAARQGFCPMLSSAPHQYQTPAEEPVAFPVSARVKSVRVTAAAGSRRLHCGLTDEERACRITIHAVKVEWSGSRYLRLQ
eukprot:CAMPEP_0177768198 /NCGR_PEP_ID=MMETSP0491_2-20121128/9581_1 /TAXON_ID=63592 /ORGANISM="Tetraselmis chuii, Strain PLY429" /LENGTH=110 /DNA_ID=CAMNT_0019284965 /DNA_START=756 /DNA_END=1088 /DNA_ORIENTATION=+